MSKTYGCISGTEGDLAFARRSFRGPSLTMGFERLYRVLDEKNRTKFGIGSYLYSVRKISNIHVNVNVSEHELDSIPDDYAIVSQFKLSTSN